MKLSHFLALTLGISGAWLAALPSARAEEAATNDFPEVEGNPHPPGNARRADAEQRREGRLWSSGGSAGKK